MQKTKPRISVVIPAYNEEKYLAECLASFQNQSFKSFELIVVDNNSTDRTAEIAKSFGARIVHETVQGMIPARERGFREALAPIIARTDADTLVPPNWLEIIYSTFQSHPKTVGLLGVLSAPNEKMPDQIFLWFTKIFFVNLGKFFTGHVFMIGSNMALKKSAWEKVKVHTLDKLVNEDVDLACHLSEVGEILFVPNLIVPISLRRVVENPWKGAARYLGDYPFRYIRTILIHNSRFKYLKIEYPYTTSIQWSTSWRRFVKKTRTRMNKTRTKITDRMKLRKPTPS